MQQQQQYVCDGCGKYKTIEIICSKCKAKYCSKYCQNEDVDLHTSSCMEMNQPEIDKSLKSFGLESSQISTTFPKDKWNHQYIHFPGKLHGDVPHCMLSLYEPESFGRTIWSTMNLPIGVLDFWYYLVRLEDLPRMIARLQKNQIQELAILLDAQSRYRMQ